MVDSNTDTHTHALKRCYTRNKVLYRDKMSLSGKRNITYIRSKCHQGDKMLLRGEMSQFLATPYTLQKSDNKTSG